jgi:DNA-binding CsgD family transcriptional regulator
MPTVAAILGPYVVAVALATGDRADARGQLEVVRDCADRSGSRLDTAICRLSAGVMDLFDTEVAAAEIAAHDALPVFASGPFPVELVDAFALLAGIAAARSQLTEAARLWGVADGIAARHGIAWTPLRQWVSREREAALSAHDREAFDQAVADGAALSLEEAVAWARRARGERGRPQIGWDSLTPTERKVVELAAAGLSNPKIGERMFISAGTVKTHLAHVYAKLGLSNRTEVAAAFAERLLGRTDTAT